MLYESKDTEKTIEIESELLIEGDSELVIFMQRFLRAIHAVAPIQSFALTSVPGSPGAFEYHITFQDGRLWRQNLVFPEGASEPNMTFSDITGSWKLSEFARQRPLRDLMVQYVFSHQLSRIEVVY